MKVWTLAPYMFFISSWHKLKVIWSLMTPRLPQIALAAPQHAEIQGWLCGGKLIPSINIMILIYSHMLTCWTRVEIVCFLASWLCLVPPYAKCRVCEDTQVARCLCNFPPAPSHRQAQRNNSEPVLLVKFGLAWIPDVLDISLLIWAGVWTTLVSWPLAQLTASLHGRTSRRGTGDVVENKDSTRCAVYL